MNINESTIKKTYEMQQKLSLEGIINTLILQNKKYKINKNFRFKELEKEEQIKKLEKEKQTNPKVCKMNEILKIRAEINEIKNIKRIKKIKPKAGFCNDREN